MIKPEPEADLSLNVMVIGADIIKILKKAKNYLIIEDLQKEFIERDKRRTPQSFFNALTFLYILGMVSEDNYKVRLNYANSEKTLL